MIKRSLPALFGLIFFSSAAFATPVDLSTWTAEGGYSNWTVQGGNDAVLQSVNGDPTVFYDPTATSTQGTALNGKIRVTTSGDDDFIGFVLGYDAGEISSSSSDFILVDWKQGNQTLSGANGYAPAGLAVSHVTDASNWWNDFWGHGGGVNEIQRGSTLGSTGWADYVEYDFNIVFTSNLIEVSVNGVNQLSITAGDAGLSSFDDGAFGFYNMSQSYVQYSAIQQLDCSITPNAPECQTVPAPAPVWLLLFGLLGIRTLRRC